MEDDLNTLLCLLRDFNVVRLVKQEYARYDNDAPAILLEQQIDKLQRYLGRVARGFAVPEPSR